MAAMAGLAAGCAKTSPPGQGEAAQKPATAVGEATGYSEEASRLVYEQDEIVSVLRNGMTVIAKRTPSPVVSVQCFVHAGSVYEGRWMGGGLSHLLEHLVAGGSCERRNESENRNLLQQIGNNSNAYTSFDQTVYFINTTAENLEKAVDLVTGWVLGAKVAPAEYLREYEVVQRELEKGQGEPERVFGQLTLHNRYRVSPMRVPVIGHKSVIQGLSRDDVYAYYRLAYQPNNMVFVVTGNLPPQRMMEAVRRYVGGAAAGRVFDHSIEAEPPVLGPRTLVATFPKLGQARLELAFPSVKLADPDLYALDLLATILGQGESSILIEEIRDKKGLASTISVSDYTPSFAEGLFAIDMELSAEKIGEATAAALEQVEKIRKEGVSEARLMRAKTQTRTARAFAQQTSAQIAAATATDYMSTGDAHFSDRYVHRMQEVTAEQVRDVARRYLDRWRLLTTALVPEETARGRGLPAAMALLRGAATTQATAAEAKSQVTRLVLDDGTIVLLKRMSGSPVAAIHMYSLGGVTAEDAKTNGLGNLTMMAVPRGTKTRSAQQIAEFFDSIGGELSTAGGNNSWNWSAGCLKEDLAKAMEVFADVVRNPVFPDDEVAAMKKRVLATIESQDADWFTQSMRFFRESYFGPRASAYQLLPIGTKERVGALTAEQVRTWYGEKILKSRRVLAVYGDVDVEQAWSLVARYFGPERQAADRERALAAAGGGQATADDAKPSIVVDRVLLNRSANPEAGVVIGFDSNSVVGSEASYALTVAGTMAGGYRYPTGYLFEVLRGKGLVYDVQAYTFAGRSEKHPGVFIVYAGCDPKDVDEVVELILQNMARLQAGTSKRERDWFARSKQLIVTADALENETPGAQAMTGALDELLGLGYDFHSKFADRIDKVQNDGVQRISRQLLKRCTVTITTNAPDAVTVRKGERRYESFPSVDLAPRGVQHDTAAGGG